ncbi:uncharacterized protein METZ01_LOCUS466690, partial [marine metagenome]
AGKIHFQISDGLLEFSLSGNSPTDQWFSHVFQTDTWTHIAFVYEGPNNRALLYINGILSQEVNYGSTRAADIGNFQFGNWSNSRPFDGMIDDFRIWNDSRTVSEIENNMFNELSGDEDGLIGYWKFDAGEGEILYDHSGNANHGDINGAAWTAAWDNPDFTFLGNFGGNQYFLSEYTLTWESAHSYLTDNFFDAHLATITSEEENTFLANAISVTGWIGFTDEEVEGDFRWVTGEDVVYTNWGGNEPN